MGAEKASGNILGHIYKSDLFMSSEQENIEIRVHTICYIFIIMFISILLLLYGHVTASGKARV